MEAVETISSPVVERPAAAGADDFGVVWAYDAAAEGGTYPARVPPVIPDVARWREFLRLPDLDGIDWGALARRARAIDRSRLLISGFVEMGLFERSYLLLSMEEALIGYLLEPEAMKGLLHALADYKIELIGRFHDACQPDMIWYGDDWGTQRSPFLPVPVWRDIVKPETQRIYDCMKRRGILINQHSCGKIDPLLPDIVEMGADMLNPCQPVNDLARMKREYGDRICFIGGIDSQFVLQKPGVTREEVEAEVRRRMDELAAGGGYIAAPSHTVPYDPEVLEAMNRAIAKYGRYPRS
jgi:hypothetical protein